MSFVQAKLGFSLKSSTDNGRTAVVNQSPTTKRHLNSGQQIGPTKRAKQDGLQTKKSFITVPDVKLDNTIYDYFGEETEKEPASASGQQQGTVTAFSIHRISVHKMYQKFSNQTRNEADIIDEIMKQVNTKYGQTREHFEKRIPPASQPSENSSSTGASLEELATRNTPKPPLKKYNFQIIVYLQKIYSSDTFLSFLNIQESSFRINKVIFYHRPGEIFAVTVGSTWQVIQPFSCYDFPYEISGRLTRTEGSLQETLKPLTGNVRSTKTTKKNASLFDQLNNVRYNVVKEVRQDSSIHWLNEFSWEDKTLTKIRFGVAYIRIEKCIKPENIAQILDHFSLICNKQDTFTYPDADIEKHVNDLPMIRPIPPDVVQLANERLCKLLFAFFHNSKASTKLYDLALSHKHVDNFLLASCFQLKYENGHGISYYVQEFSRCPTALEVCSTLREKCKELSISDYFKFKSRIGSNVKLIYFLNDEKHESKVWDLLEGDISLENHGDFCRILGQWCLVRDEYHFEVHKKFLDLLSKDNLLLYPGQEGVLWMKWNPTLIKTIRNYVEGYKNIPGFFFPSRKSEDDCLFDLLYVTKNKERRRTVYLYYLFDRFDAGIRYCSTKILKSLELLFADGVNKSSDKKGSTALQDFYDGQCSRFKNEFQTCETFQTELVYGNVFVVVGFVTETWKGVNKMEGKSSVGLRSPITNYFPTLKQEKKDASIVDDTRIRSFYHERMLQLHFNGRNVQTYILKQLPERDRKYICEQLDASSDDTNILGDKLINRFIEKGYCTGNDDSKEKPVSGKLLKLKNSADFKLFDDVDVNYKIFKLLQKKFITQFPGIIHKLECFRIHESVMQWPKINLRFAEIMLDAGNPYK